MDKQGQLSIEYILFFLIFLIIFATISIPTLSESINDVNDMKDVTETKIALTEISNNIKIVYASGTNSKKVTSIYMPQNTTIRTKTYKNKNYLTADVKLRDNTTKTVEVEVPCNISFNGNINHYYKDVKNRWYYNTQIDWIIKEDKMKVNININ